jgi:hypothetical protein
MNRVSKTMAALVVGLSVSALATPTFAQRAEGMSDARAQALRECTGKAGKLMQYVWGDQQIETYRSCMAQHGQQE